MIYFFAMLGIVASVFGYLEMSQTCRQDFNSGLRETNERGRAAIH